MSRELYFHGGWSRQRRTLSPSALFHHNFLPGKQREKEGGGHTHLQQQIDREKGGG